MKNWRVAAVLLAALEASACSTAHVAQPKPAAIRQEEHRPWSLSPPIGVSMPDEAVVHVVSKGVGCSGTLITNNLVLTAHHCVVERSPEGAILEKDLPAERAGGRARWGLFAVGHCQSEGDDRADLRVHRRSRRHRGAGPLAQARRALDDAGQAERPSPRGRGHRACRLRPLPAVDGRHPSHPPRGGPGRKAEPRIDLRVRLDLPGRFGRPRPQPDDRRSGRRRVRRASWTTTIRPATPRPSPGSTRGARCS